MQDGERRKEGERAEVTPAGSGGGGGGGSGGSGGGPRNPNLDSLHLVLSERQAAAGLDAFEAYMYVVWVV